MLIHAIGINAKRKQRPIQFTMMDLALMDKTNWLELFKTVVQHMVKSLKNNVKSFIMWLATLTSNLLISTHVFSNAFK